MPNILMMAHKEHQEILGFHLEKVVYSRVTNKVLRLSFERRAKKFAVDPRTNVHKYKRSDNFSLHFFTAEEVKHRNQYIKHMHNRAGHSW